jgi:HD-GYP domain-containing protein (c-di-GMP phosphodiesterase class II)
MENSVSGCIEVLERAQRRSESIESPYLRLPPDAICSRLKACLSAEEARLIESSLAAMAPQPTVSDGLFVRRFYRALAQTLRDESFLPLFQLADSNRNDRTAVLVSVACATLADALTTSGQGSPATTGFCAILAAAITQRCDRARAVARTGTERTARADELEGLLTTLRSYDVSLYEKAHAVSALSARLGVHVGLDREAVSHVADSALLCDIGTVGVSRALLEAPRKLTESELREVRQHAALGAQIVDEFAALSSCSPVVRAHHEWVDGSGYPDGLRGSDIPFAARIICVADAFCALTQARRYRAALTAREALAQIRAGRDSQFDPMVVDALCELVGSRTNRGTVSTIGVRA